MHRAATPQRSHGAAEFVPRFMTTIAGRSERMTDGERAAVDVHVEFDGAALGQLIPALASARVPAAASRGNRKCRGSVPKRTTAGDARQWFSTPISWLRRCCRS